MAERQERMASEAVPTRIGQVVMLHHAGDREEARRRLLDLWTELGEDGDPVHRCTLAHYLADTQDDPADELAWDLRALTEAEGAGGALAVRALYPSLHLNLAADYVKLDRAEAARVHLSRARGAAGALGNDSYGDGVRAVLRGLVVRWGVGPLELGGRRARAGDVGSGLGAQPARVSTAVSLLADLRLRAVRPPAAVLLPQRADVRLPRVPCAPRVPLGALADGLRHVGDLDVRPFGAVGTRVAGFPVLGSGVRV